MLDLEFETVLSSEMARSYKPQPELFLEMLARLALRAEETVYVGDRHYEDVHGARSVGMHAVWINRGDRDLRDDLPAPTHAIKGLTELPSTIQKIHASALSPQ